MEDNIGQMQKLGQWISEWTFHVRPVEAEPLPKYRKTAEGGNERKPRYARNTAATDLNPVK